MMPYVSHYFTGRTISFPTACESIRRMPGVQDAYVGSGPYAVDSAEVGLAPGKKVTALVVETDPAHAAFCKQLLNPQVDGLPVVVRGRYVTEAHRSARTRCAGAAVEGGNIVPIGDSSDWKPTTEDYLQAIAVIPGVRSVTFDPRAGRVDTTVTNPEAARYVGGIVPTSLCLDNQTAHLSWHYIYPD